jgi:hypothetical protein
MRYFGASEGCAIPSAQENRQFGVWKSRWDIGCESIGGCMSDITILYRKDKFAVSVDGAYQDIKTEADVLAKLLELGITRDRAEDAITMLKEKGEVQI